jgi:hypothetical protein
LRSGPPFLCCVDLAPREPGLGGRRVTGATDTAWWPGCVGDNKRKKAWRLGLKRV